MLVLDRETACVFERERDGDLSLIVTQVIWVTRVLHHRNGAGEDRALIGSARRRASILTGHIHLRANGVGPQLVRHRVGEYERPLLEDRERRVI